MFDNIKDLLKKFCYRKYRIERREEQSTRETKITGGTIMRRLLENEDFKYYQNILRDAEMPLLEKSLEDVYKDQRDNLITRINQIEDIIKLPIQLIKRMEMLPEFIEAKRKKSRERQALGKKTGG